MINRKLFLALLIILAAAGLIWFYGSKDSAQFDRKKALEERLSQIPFTAEQLFPNDSSLHESGAEIIMNKLMRNQIADSTLTHADVYLNSHIVGLIRAIYKLSNNTVYIEIGQFASPNDGYGFYSQNRPSGVAFDTVGTESYYTSDTLHFTKSTYVVSVTASAPEDRYATIKTIARLIENNIGSSSMPPLFFRLFPYRGQLVQSQKYYSMNYLGVEGLDEVYTVDYVVDEDTLTLFLTSDTSGSKFIKLSDHGQDIDKIDTAPEGFEYPERSSLSFHQTDYGQIVAGLVSRKLAGVIGYNRATGLELCTKWIKGLH